MDDLLVSDGTNEEILVDFDPDTFTEAWQQNQAWSISFTVIKTARNAFSYDLLQNENTVIYNGQTYVIKDCEPQATGSVLTKAVTANHVMFTCQDWHQDSQDSKTWSITDALNWAFQDNPIGFDFEVIGSFDTQQMDNFGDANALDMLNTILSTFGGIVDANNKHLIIYSAAEWGSQTEKQVRYQYNTDTVQCTIDTTGLKTIIKGYGAQNDDGSYVFSPVTYTSPNVDKYGPRYADPIRDERFTSSDSMLAYLPSQIQDNPVVSLTTPLKRAEDVQKGEHWLLIYEPMALDLDVQIVAYNKYPYSPGKPPDVTWSNTVKDAVNIMSSLSAAASTVNKAIDPNGTIKDTSLGTTVSGSLQKINSVITSDGNIDLSKASGRLTNDHVSVGADTQFASGYDPSTIYRLTSLQQTGIATLRNWLWGTNSGGGPDPNTEQSDSPAAIHLNPVVPNPVYADDGTLSEDSVELLDLVLQDIRGDVWQLFKNKPYVDALKIWLTDPSSSPVIFNPIVSDPRTPGQTVDLATLLADLQQRLVTLGG